jgi:quinol monooxygenase YgiN
MNLELPIIMTIVDRRRSWAAMIYVHATIEVKPGRRAEFLAEFRKIIPLVRAEQGCLEYGPAVDHGTDITAQADLRDDIVEVVEKWESVEALNEHLNAPHMVMYRPKVRDLLVGTTLRIMRPAEEANPRD